VTGPAAPSAATIRLPGDLASAMLAHARAELPNEACGLLGGIAATGRVSSFHAARNRHASPLRYDAHPEDLVRIMFALESAGEDLISVFHSHTRTPAVPSRTDLREARYDVVHLIATLADPAADAVGALRAWRVRDGSAVEVAVRISE
jgi:[CysO sulfur-carrier protein]-S-L-cysteine hydrolase